MAANNFFKGYTYQEQVLQWFVQLMDLNRNIKKIISEAETPHNFDDMNIIDENNSLICFQVKNYKDFDITEVKIDGNTVKINAGGTKTNPKFEPFLENALIVNSEFECDSEILGLKAKLIDGIYVIPLTHNNYEKQIGNYLDINRENYINNLVGNKISNEYFEFTLEELPKIPTFSNKLKHETIILDNIPKINNKLSWYLGEPGTGKSHLVKEIEDTYENCIVYRFYADEHDENRLKYENFIEDLTYRIFDSPKKRSDAEIINKIIKDKLIILIDGLDHVVNYNEHDLDKFLDFFKLLKDTKTLIFTRPFPKIMNNENLFYIPHWNKENTFEYLKQYKFKDEINEKIYELSNGYPIITFYLSEEYKLNKNFINYPKSMKSLNEYYEKILENIDLKTPLELFLFCNSYILEEELEYLLGKNNTIILHEFIKKCPYLFNKDINRIQLFHDSLFTYLREKSQLENHYPINQVKKSILSKNINFLSRFNSFEFEDEFVKEVLKLYSDFDTFIELKNNFDFESIKIFYLNLRKTLKKFPNTLDIYQYYSLILINLIVDRHNYYDEFGIIYQMFKYTNLHKDESNNIYSDKLLWSLYKYYTEHKIDPFKKLLKKEHYDERQMVRKLNRDWSIENIFYSEYKGKIDEKRILNYISTYFDYELLQEYLAYLWINKKEKSKYFKFINDYINNLSHWDDELEFEKELKKLQIRWPPKWILHGAKLKIYEKGLLIDENIYLNTDLNEFWKNNRNKSSYEIYSYLLAYLRLSNLQKTEFDIQKITEYYHMYYSYKDYSVEKITNALLIFEKNNCISEDEYIKLILNIMDKSNDGIEHLSLDYLTKKSSKTIEKLCEKHNPELMSELNYYDSEIINKFPIKVVSKNFHMFNKGREIDFNRINNILKSVHQEYIMNTLKFLNYSVYNVPKDYSTFFEDKEIEFSLCKNDEKNDFFESENLLERNYLKKDDYNEIKLNKITHLELAKLQDSNYDCLPYPEFFEIYDKEKIKQDLLMIIHNAICTKLYFSDKYWVKLSFCLGNIPHLIDYCNYEIDWNKLFNIFKMFIESSGIPLN